MNDIHVFLGLLYPIFACLLGAFLLFCIAEVLRKAGYPMWWAFGALVPPLIVVGLIALAFMEWPIERERERAHKRIADLVAQETPPAELPDNVLQLRSLAIRAEQIGNWSGAINLYEQIAEHVDDATAARAAREKIESLRKRAGVA
ncbi:MAG: hypothetical protein GC159_22680 [Phycisphaera sp.]|nr:hypothetical protein [Phycisphaera sp.]